MYKTLCIAAGRRHIRLAISLAVVISVCIWASGKVGITGIFSLQFLYSYGLAFVGVLLLAPLNLFLETEKWRCLMHPYRLSAGDACWQVMRGIAWGFLTPNRIGEHAGRIASFPPNMQAHAAAMSAVGSAAQTAITLAAGTVAIAFFQPFTAYRGFLLGGYGWVALALAAVLAGLFTARKWNLLRSAVSAAFKSIVALRANVVFRALGLAMLRYLVFSSQYVILLLGMDCSLDPMECSMGVALLFFCQSFVPGALLGEFGIRESLAVAIFGAFMPVILLPALIATSIWLVNLALPALIAAMRFGMIPRSAH